MFECFDVPFDILAGVFSCAENILVPISMYLVEIQKVIFCAYIREVITSTWYKEREKRGQKQRGKEEKHRTKGNACKLSWKEGSTKIDGSNSQVTGKKE